ncbi:hypothetical protein Tco_0299890 [Tanacetum coccineum]
MVNWLSIVETDKVIHTMETDIVKLVVEIESFGMSSDEFDKETGLSDGLQPKQADLSCIHALNKLHLHEIRVVPSEAHEPGQILDEEQLTFLADPGVPNEVPHSETYLNDMDNHSVHAMQDFEQTSVVNVTDNEITSDSNIIPYSQYLQETQQANVRDTNLQAQQDSMILSVIEQMSEQMINHVNN